MDKRHSQDTSWADAGTAVERTRLSPSRYRSIVEEQPDLICRFLPDGTLTFANEAYCRYFGFAREEVTGQPFNPIVHPEDLPEVEALLGSLSPTHPVVSIENRVRRADGVMRWTQWTNRALYDERGRVVELQSSGRDVTERRQAEEDAARLAVIVESADVAIFSMSLDGVILSWNRAAERMFGYTATDAIGHGIDLIIPPDRPHEASELLRRLRRGETITHFETERLARDGRRIPVSLIVSPIRDAHGHITGISKIARDITDRRRAERELQEREARFRLMADQAPVLIWIADTNNNGIYFNRPWLDFTGVPMEAQIGDGWLSLVEPDDRARTAAYCQEHVDRRLPFTMEFRLRHHSGEYRWVQDTGQPLFLPDGTFNGYIGSCVDISDRKRLEMAREQEVQRESEARSAAEDASRLKDEFLAIVSHELRTPLNAILGWSRMLRDHSVPPEAVPKALETIERNAHVQVQLVEDLLDVSRIVTGRLSLRTEPVNLAAVVQAAVEAVRPAAANKRIELRVELVDPDTTVSGDAGRLQQAVWNLLTNAVKFTPRGGRVEVRLLRTEADATITVRDTGSGIPREALHFIFDRFRQVDSRTTRPHGGLGLGLALVRSLAEAHGGVVRADSAGPGLGATFELTLPIGADASADSDGDDTAVARADLTGRRVLVVDDESDSRDLMAAVLQRSGAAVVLAESVVEAMAALRETRPDVLIGDVGMPGRDGYDLIRQVRNLAGFERIPAIAVTAYAGEEHREAALKAGYDEHFAKPFDGDAVCRTIADLCAAASAT